MYREPCLNLRLNRTCMQAWHRHRYRKRSRAISDQAVEAYLREDVPCGSPSCSLCSHTMPSLPKAMTHLLIPDASTLESYLEIFQLPEMHGVVYTNSAVKQVSLRGQNGNSIILLCVACPWLDLCFLTTGLVSWKSKERHQDT